MRSALRAGCTLVLANLASLVLVACGDLVGVDFGAAHLEMDSGEPDGSRTDGSAGDARSHDAADAKHDAKLDGSRDSGGCNPQGTPRTDPCIIDEAYGVFVAPAANGGSDSGAGTRAHPYATVRRGIAKSRGTRVFVCGAEYAEQVVVGASVDGVRVYGGLLCPPLLVVMTDASVDAEAGGDAATMATGDAVAPGDAVARADGATDAGASADAGGPAWSYSGVKAIIAPAALGYALQVEGLVVGSSFEDLGFVAETANPADEGSSSIGVMVNGSQNVSFSRVSVTVGDGAPGSDAIAATSNAATMPLTGGAGADSVAGIGQNIACPSFGSSAGGNGLGLGAAATPANSGTCAPAPTTLVAPRNGKVGSGGQVCADGDPGAPGAAAGGGGAGTQGSLSELGWVLGTPGTTAAASDPGQGGGGGGDATSTGGAGGGGGAGGCGGNGGRGGGGGGASIGVAVVSSTARFASVELQTGSGGAGGAGAAGLPGQAGGVGGASMGPLGGVGCSGGTGGSGAGGSGGGGGAGGPSAGIGWSGSVAPVVDGAPTASASGLRGPSAFGGGQGGASGPGGTAGAAVSLGAPGHAGTGGPAGSAGAVLAF